jgi:hypothetical protein
MVESGGRASFDFNQMIKGMGDYVSSVKSYLSQLETATGGQVDLGMMFSMQFHMQVMSQYVEAVSNTLSAVHNNMMSMARAVKGQ